MSDNTPNHDMLQLIDAHFDGALTEQEAAALRQWILDDDCNAQAFVRHSILHHRIHENMRQEDIQDALGISFSSSSFAGREIDGSRVLEEVEKNRVANVRLEAARMLEQDKQESAEAERRESIRRLAGLSKLGSGPRTRHYVIPKPLFYGGIAAMIAIAVAIIWPMLRSETKPFEPGSTSPQHFEVATLVEQFDAEWERSLHPIATGGPIFNERLKLAEGFAKLRFRNEAEVILEAPCEIEPVSETKLRIIHGKLVGVCRTASSKGFIVESHNATIVDLGTEFGIAVDENGSLEAHVMEGEVALTPIIVSGPKTTVSIKSGKGRRVSADASKVDVIDSDQYQFVRGMRPEDRDPMRGYVAAVKAMNPVVYYRFESISGGIIPNEMDQKYRARAIGNVTTGRTPAGNAIRLSGGYVQLLRPIEELWDAPQYTVECWVKSGEIQDGYQSSIISMVVDREDPSETPTVDGIFLHADQGADQSIPLYRLRYLHRSPPSDTGGSEIFAPQDYQANTWMHVVGVKTPSHLILYVNGKEAVRKEDDLPWPNVEFTTRIGTHIPSPLPDHRRPFKGLIDEVAVYNVALTKDEIEKHYSRMISVLEN